MKKIIAFFLISLTMFSIFAISSNVEAAVETKRFEPTKNGDKDTHQFQITFEGNKDSVLYSDIGFATAPTTLTSGSGLSKRVIENNAVTMAHKSSSTTKDYNKSDTYYSYYEYEATVYVYWYCSFNSAKKLQMTVEPGTGCAVGFTYIPYTYSISSNTLDTTGKAQESVTVNASTSTTGPVDIAKFPGAIAVYHGNSKVDFTAKVSAYPSNGVIAKVTLTLVAGS